MSKYLKWNAQKYIFTVSLQVTNKYSWLTSVYLIMAVKIFEHV